MYLKITFPFFCCLLAERKEKQKILMDFEVDLLFIFQWQGQHAS